MTDEDVATSKTIVFKKEKKNVAMKHAWTKMEAFKTLCNAKNMFQHIDSNNNTALCFWPCNRKYQEKCFLKKIIRYWRLTPKIKIKKFEKK